MNKYYKLLAYANCNAMEPETIQKNEASPKSRTSRKNLFIIFLIALMIGFVIPGCDKKDTNNNPVEDPIENDPNKEKPKGDSDDKKDEPKEVDPYGEQGLTLIKKVGDLCENYLESYLEKYFSQGGNVDINQLIKNINSIDDIEEASPNDDNSAVRIKLKNGAYFNFIIFRRDDERWGVKNVK